MMLTLGKEYTDEGVMPSVKSLGRQKFLRYAILMVTMHCFVYFTLEAMTWRYFYVVLMKTAVSVAATLLGVWLVSLLFTVGTPKKI
jgi:FlaA1/EpsC-like NDP-sugar epimerase